MLFVHLLLLWFTPGSHDSMVSTIPGGGGVLPYMGYIGIYMCGPKGYGFVFQPFWS